VASLTFALADETNEYLCKDNRCKKNLHVSKDWSFMRWVDRVCSISRPCASEGVMPFSGNLSASGYRNDRCRDWLVVRVDSTIANNIVRRHICDGLTNGKKSEC